MSLAIAIVLMLLLYLFLFELKTHAHLMKPVDEEEGGDSGTNGCGMDLETVNLHAAFGHSCSGVLERESSEFIEEAAKFAGLTPVFVGVILLAIIGNAAENSTAILMAQNKPDLFL